MEAPSSSPPHSRLSLAVITLLQEKSQAIRSLPFNAAAMSLGWDLFALLSDLAAHSSVSSAPQAVPCRAPRPSLVVWMLLLPWGCTWAALDCALLPLDHGGFLPPSSCHLYCQILLVWSLGPWSCHWVSLPIPVTVLLPPLPCPGYQRELLMLVQCLSRPGSLMTNKKPDSLSKNSTIIYLLTPLF